MGKERVPLWDNLKFFAIICILVMHSTIPYAMDGMKLMKYCQTFINLYPMTLFTIISGFWFKEKPIKILVILFLWPCLLFTIVNGILGETSPHFPNYMKEFMFKAGYAMWYLLALFIFSIATKLLNKKFSATAIMVLALVVAIAIGSLPIPNRFLDIQRISCLFPSFIFGVWLRTVVCKGTSTLPLLENTNLLGRMKISYRECCIFILFCVLVNLACYYLFPTLKHFDSFTTYYGLNFKAACFKWFLYIIRIIACTCLIFVVPNKKYWFTEYGSRTMNVYLLHMLVIFPLSWGLLYNYRNEWYGEVAFFLLIPLLCSLFISSAVDRFMKKILLTKLIN